MALRVEYGAVATRRRGGGKCWEYGTRAPLINPFRTHTGTSLIDYCYFKEDE